MIEDARDKSITPNQGITRIQPEMGDFFLMFVLFKLKLAAAQSDITSKPMGSDMNTFKNFKIGTRLSLAVACVLLMMCGVAGTGMWGLGSLYDISMRVLSQDVKL